MNTDTSVYTDLSGFTSLRAEAQSNPDGTLHEVAKQFESIFVQMMVKAMRDASEPLQSDWLSSNQMDSYQQMFDQQLSLDLSNRGGIGLAEVIASQLGGEQKQISATHQNNESGDLARYRLLEQTSVAVQPPVIIDQENSKEIEDVAALSRGSLAVTEGVTQEQARDIQETQDTSETSFSEWLPKTPKEFIESLWGFAQKAGDALGLNPKVILAQAALETGWGKHMIPNGDGSNSFNLFGIKGGTQWSGRETTVATLEYENGVPEKQSAKFRSYSSLAESFIDYVKFLTQSPRYEQALSAVDDKGFLSGLQEGGYATDPNYAEKILGILNRPEFQDVVPEAAAPEGKSI